MDTKLRTGGTARSRWIWNNASTMTAQLIDTVVFIGIAFGIAMGLCLRDVDFHYEGHEGGKPLGNSASEDV